MNNNTGWDFGLDARDDFEQLQAIVEQSANEL